MRPADRSLNDKTSNDSTSFQPISFPIIGIIYGICGVMNQLSVLRQLRGIHGGSSGVYAPVLDNEKRAKTMVGATSLLHAEQALLRILYESLARSLGSIHRFVFLELCPTPLA